MSGDSELARREREQKRRKATRSEARDIVHLLHEPKDPERRERCRTSLKLFCESYFPETFNMGWSEDHLVVVAKTERSVLHGGLFAMALPRGSGKSTISECAGMWGTLYGHCDFIVLIGAEERSAEEMLESIKTSFETNELLEEDFSWEIGPIIALDGIPHRAAGQVCEGQRTHIGWTAKEIVMPTTRLSTAKSAVMRVAGITGRIRGMKFKRPDGKLVRPKLVIVDDPQTDDSAKSVSQSQAREAVLAGAILGLAGPGKKISGIMPCTVIKAGDMADRILDRQKHPEWNGERMRMVYAWPKNGKLWEEYALIRAQSLRQHGDIRDATAFYASNRKAMDEGAKVAWEARFNHDELSALQNAMNLRLMDEAAFFAEYQNEPIPDKDQSSEDLTADLVASRLSGLERGTLPTWTNRITAFIDVQQKTLWWIVVAWSDACNGAIIDYGVFPDQGRAYFTLKDAKLHFAHIAELKGAALEGQIAGALEILVNALMLRRFAYPDATTLGIERILIDANWGQSTETVYGFCQRSQHSASIYPSHGRYIGASSTPMSQWAKKPGERTGHNWRIVKAKRGLRGVTYDTNAWKTWVKTRIFTAPGDVGTLLLHGKDPDRHRMIADQFSSEYCVRTTGRGRTVDEWKLKPARDNHWWDGIVGAAVAASIQGMPAEPPSSVTVSSEKKPAPAGARTRQSFKQLQEAARKKKQPPR
jgi:hypothetical protein